MFKKYKTIFAGSFDPIHDGHIDIIKRAKKKFPYLIIVVSNNINKGNEKTFNKRLKNTAAALKDLDVEVIGLDKGLVANYAKSISAKYLVRGYRNKADLKYEKQMAEVNHIINPNIETVFLKSRMKYRHFSSSKIRNKKENK